MIGYGLIAGLSYTEMMSMQPGAVLDMFIFRRNYDDGQHHIVRGD